MRFLLYPFSFIYYIITTVRNILYDYQIFKSKKHKIPIICVGNLSMGGTGKTPHTDYITKLLEKKYNLAIISRGYGRRSSGFKYVKLNSDPLDIGDEPLMLKNKNPNTIGFDLFDIIHFEQNYFFLFFFLALLFFEPIFLRPLCFFG